MISSINSNINSETAQIVVLTIRCSLARNFLLSSDVSVFLLIIVLLSPRFRSVLVVGVILVSVYISDRSENIVAYFLLLFFDECMTTRDIVLQISYIPALLMLMLLVFHHVFRLPALLPILAWLVGKLSGYRFSLFGLMLSL